MKSSYLFTFLLLLLLLLHKSLSFPITKPILEKADLVKRIVETLKEAASHPKFLDKIKEFREKELEARNLPNPPLTKPLPGLSLFKDYFSNFGYLPSSGGKFNDYMDQATISAITKFQQHYNLNVTSNLSTETLQQIVLPRCRIPDINFDYDFADDNISWPKSGNRWFPNSRNLTYGFAEENHIPANMTKALKNAFARWAQSVKGLNLTETIYEHANIKVGFYDFDAGVEDMVWGDSVIRLNPANVTAGEIRLDANKNWKLLSENGSVSRKKGVLDLESAAMHQIGHLLGLDHSNDSESVMYPYVLPSQQLKVELSDSDKANIALVYTKDESAKESANGGHCWGVVRIATLALGFGCYLVLLA